MLFKPNTKQQGWLAVMRIFIFDDEVYFLDSLKKEIEIWAKENNKTIDCLTAVGSTQDFCVKRLYDDDIFFLDIADGQNENAGIRLAREIRRQNAALHIIFVTSHHEKIRDAVSGLIRPSEFLIKPLGGAEREKLHILLNSLFGSGESESIEIKIGHDNIRISLREILFIAREKRKTVIVTGNQRYMIRESFSSLTARLNGDFVVTEKGAAVNVGKIEAWNPSDRRITICDTQMYYSRERSKEIRQLMMERGVPIE